MRDRVFRACTAARVWLREPGLRQALSRAFVLSAIAACLLPIVLGAATESEIIRRDQYKAMRAEHMRRVAVDQLRMAERRRDRLFFPVESRPTGRMSRRALVGIEGSIRTK